MRRTDILMAILVAAGTAAVAGQTKAPRISAADYPCVSLRVKFFEDRINSPDPKIRSRVMTEVGYFFTTPDQEYVAFLRRMMKDGDPVVAGQAVRKLHRLFVPVEVKDLPRRFAGYHDDQIVDLADREATTARLLKECGSNSAGAGYAAYVLGVLRHGPAVPALRGLAGHRNIFVRYAAGRALIDCGDAEGARAILKGIVLSQLHRYARLEDTPADKRPRDWTQRPNPHYTTVACRALVQLGHEDRRFGLEGLIRLIGHLERSEDINDQAHLHHVRAQLSYLAGKWLPTQRDARQWYETSGRAAREAALGTYAAR